VPILRRGKLVRELPCLEEIRTRAQQQLAMLSPGTKRFDNPHQYPAWLELGLYERKMNLMLRTRGQTATG
jgi:nicotinate phosphoribosyltransferase